MNLSELLATWQTWNERNVVEQALRRAEADGRDDDADQLRRSLQTEEPPSAVEALAAQHELAELLGGWRWHTVTAAREQGATWSDVAAATGTDAATAREAYREQVATAEHAAEAYGIPFRDAERYRAAARDDTDTPTPTDLRVQTAEETPAMTDHQPIDRDDLQVEYISGPDLLDDGLVVGEIALPGGLPPDEEDDDVHGEITGHTGPHRPAVLDRSVAEVLEAAEANGEPPLEAMNRYRAEYMTAVRADPQLHAEWLRAELMAAYAAENVPPSYDREVMDDWVRQPITQPSHTAQLEAQLAEVERDAADSRGGRAAHDAGSEEEVSTSGEPSEPSIWPTWADTEEGRARIGRWAAENADPAKALDDSHPDDPDRLQRRLDDLRVRLTGYTWREGVDRDEAIAGRREQLGRWYADDQAEQHTDTEHDDDAAPSAAQIECGPDVGKTP